MSKAQKMWPQVVGIPPRLAAALKKEKAMWLNKSGQPVATTPITIQFDLPSEPIDEASMGSVNWIAVFVAGVQLITAFKSGDPAAIAAAIQALLNAFKG